jgi:hypothetical protein
MKKEEMGGLQNMYGKNKNFTQVSVSFHTHE